MLGLVVALPQEAKPILRAGIWELVPISGNGVAYKQIGTPVQVVLAVSGVGKQAVENTAREIIFQFNPRAVISLGFAGGLQDKLSAGDIVLATPITILPGSHAETSIAPGQSSPAHSEIFTTVSSLLNILKIPYVVGPSLTSAEVITKPANKRRLGELTSAKIVEMEDGWVSLLCHKKGIPFIAIRVVLDTVDSTIPRSAAEFLRLLLNPTKLVWGIRFLLNLRRAQRSLTNLGGALIKHSISA